MRILRRKNEWNRPVKTVFAAERNRRRGYIAHLPRHLGQAHDAAEGTRVVDDVRVQRIRNGLTTLSGSNGKPIPLGDLSVVSAAGDRCGAAVLLRSVDPIGEPVIGGHSVKLSRWLVVPRAPGLAAIYADGRALIDAQDNSLRICGIDPHRMVVISAGKSMPRNLRPGNALVGRFVKPAARAKQSPLLPRLSYAVPKRREDHARIARFETEVHGAGYIVLEQNSPPRASAVNGPKNATLLVRSEAVPHGRYEHDVRIARVHKDAPNVPRAREPKVLPRLSAIRRFIDAIPAGNV